MTKRYKWPKALGLKVDRVYALRQDVKALQKKVDAELRRLKVAKDLARVKEELVALEEHLIQDVQKSELEGAAGKTARCGLLFTDHYSIEDTTRFFNYVQRYKAWDLLPKRIVADALRERLNAGKRVPGVRTFTVLKLSVTKR